MFVEIAPASPDLFFHKSVDVVEVNRFHRLQELESGVKEARRLFVV